YGKIDVHSQEGKGTEFVIRLPLGNGHLKPDEIVSVPNMKYDFQKGKEIKVFLPDEEQLENANDEKEKDGEVKHIVEPGEHDKEVILVVEDNPDVRKYIRGPLESLYTVVEAEDGKEGMAKAREIIPDLIVSDIMMPKADGYELCRELKKDIATSHIPIILLTAKASEESIIQGLETGADDYVTKPFNSRILLTRIKNLIDLRRQLQLKIQRQKMLLPSEITVSSMDDKFLKEFQDLIEKNISNEEFDVDKLCSKMYMGRSTLFRKVKALTGETPNQFILSYRLERGAQLLRENYGNVTEVAFAVGFSSSTYFATCFKDKFGQAPSSYQAAEYKSS
ncbi:MAG TPA: response regulator, partial [Candidatus Deferrimicrobium sp.]|nr:response regulator [Candidatus Deferrimicrobium sp.]